MTTLVYYPYAPIELPLGQLTVIETASPHVYLDLLHGIRDEHDTITFADDSAHLVDAGKATTWYGDLELEVDLNKLFQRLMIKRLLNVISDQASIELLDAARELLRQVLEDSFSLDVPLEVENSPSLDNIVKFSGLRFSTEAIQTPYDKLEVLLRTLVELGTKKIPVFTNLSHFLDVNQFQQLTSLLTGLNIPAVAIEFSSVNCQSRYPNAHCIWIDQDFNDSRGELE